mgnify:CR=1 FL=1
MNQLLTAITIGALVALAGCQRSRNETVPPIVPMLAADLIISKIAGPTNGTRSQSISIAVTNKNIGNFMAGTSRTGVYICSNTNNVYGGVLLIACDMGSITAGASRGFITNATIPATAPTGSVFLSAIADDPRVFGASQQELQPLVTESNENNNTNSTPITILP